MWDPWARHRNPNFSPGARCVKHFKWNKKTFYNCFFFWCNHSQRITYSGPSSKKIASCYDFYPKMKKHLLPLLVFIKQCPQLALKLAQMCSMTSPRSAALSSCRSCRWSSPWSRCPPCSQTLAWRSRLHIETESWSFQRCCSRWSGFWTCNQSSVRKTPFVHNGYL